MTKDVCEERIKELYRALGYKSASAMARDCGIKPSSMNLYLSGERHPDLEALYKLCSSFDCSADWLLGLTDVRSSSKDVRTAVTSLGIDERYLREILKLDQNERNAFLDLLTIPGLIEDIIPDLTVIERINSVLEKAEEEDVSAEDLLNQIKMTMKLQNNDYILLTKSSAAEYYARKVGDAITTRLQEKTERIISERIGY